MIRFGAMGKRIFLIVFSVTLAIFLSFGLVTLKTLNEAAYMNGKSQIETMLQQLQGKLEQEYHILLQLSEQLMPHGPVGNLMQDFLDSKDSYEEGENKRKLSKAFSTYGGLWTQLMMYYDMENDSTVFSNYLYNQPLTQQSREQTIFRNPYLSYQAVHASYYQYSSNFVTSITREIEFANKKKLMIYLELLSDPPKVIESAGRFSGIPYIFVQTDNENIVRYSSRPEVIPLLGQIDLTDDFGMFQDYYYARSTLPFGSQSLVLAPVSSFASATAHWARRAAAVSALVVLFVLAATWLMYRHVFKGLAIFQSEIDRALDVDLEPVGQRTNIQELDQLLAHFDLMKASIKHSIREMKENEIRQAIRERELLMYQINPHFLLNTLNSLHWLALMNQQEEISGYVSSLSQILSYNLGRQQKHPTLRDELRILELYLKIELARHDFHLNIRVEEGQYLDTETPRLILQPLVENAIGHGLGEGGRLEISVHCEKLRGLICIDILDDGCGISETVLAELNSGEHAGLGLKYVRTVLKVFYHGQASFSIGPREGGGTAVAVCLPYSEQVEDDKSIDY